MNTIEYKRTEKLLSLMHDKNWVKTISELKNLDIDNENFAYKVTYKQESQRKNRTSYFHSVQYIEETKMFIFTTYESDFETGKLTDKVRDRYELHIVEVISYEKNKKNDFYFG